MLIFGLLSIQEFTFHGQNNSSTFAVRFQSINESILQIYHQKIPDHFCIYHWYIYHHFGCFSMCQKKIDDFVLKQAPLNEIIFNYYFNFVPYFINLFSPLFIFISAIYFTSRMASNSEFIAVLSSGTNFYKILIPYLMAGMMLAGLAFFLNGWVIPQGTRKKSLNLNTNIFSAGNQT